jgi:hypothetical protein
MISRGISIHEAHSKDHHVHPDVPADSTSKSLLRLPFYFPLFPAERQHRPYSTLRLISKSHTLPLGRENNLKASSKQHALELMLQEIPGVTPSGSVGIAEEWKSFRRLMEGFERKAGDEGVGSARILLEGCKVGPICLLSATTGRLADRFMASIDRSDT